MVVPMGDTQPPPGVLVLEDEVIIGMEIAMSLEEAGFSVIGPFKTVDRALDALDKETPAFGLLDLNLGRDTTSERAAEALTDMGCPFLFLTGYEASSHPVIKKFPEAECFSKPVDVRTVARKIHAVLAS